ncbi:MAG: beta-lactamase family protein [Bacteroidales bacterium]|nr:beta-lactamase family protein [Bacteroidales bacterium]
MKAILIICQIILAFGTTSLTYGQINSYSENVSNRIKKVENSLMNWVQTPDSLLRWNIEERMKSHKVNGVSIAVVHNFKIEWAKGYGWADVDEKREVTTQTLFQAASISKSVSAVGILKLVEDKIIDIDTDINQYLSSWKFPYDSVTKSKKITVRNLLNHSAGLSVSGFPGYFFTDSIPTIVQILDGKPPSKTPAVRSELEPGIQYQYSGGGVCITQLIMTDVTNQPFEKYMQNSVLKPLGMNESFFIQPPPLEKKELLATAYNRDGSEVLGKYCIYPELAAGGLWTTPTDLAKYIVETQLSLIGKSSKVLSPEMTKIRLTPFDGYSALGVYIHNKGKYFEFSGGNYGFTSVYWADKVNGNGVVVMSNSANVEIVSEIVSSVAVTYHWDDFYKPVIKNIVSVPDSILNSYVGDYLFGDKIIYIIKKNNKLFTVEDCPWELYFTSESDFFISEFESNMRFKHDSDGNVTGILDLNNGRIASKIMNE